MSDEALLRRRIRKLQRELEMARDDSEASRHRAIAGFHLDLGEREEAAKWYLKAAEHEVWCELGLKAVTYAKLAVRAAPESAEARKVYEQMWSRWAEGPAPDPLK